MNIDKFFDCFTIFSIVIIVIILFFMVVLDDTSYYYEGVTLDNEIVELESVSTYKGAFHGTDKDGVVYQLKQYKRIEKN